MAWIEQRRRADGGLTARVIWRLGGGRDAVRASETFSIGSAAQNLARADGFKRMVEGMLALVALRGDVKKAVRVARYSAGWVRVPRGPTSKWPSHSQY